MFAAMIGSMPVVDRAGDGGVAPLELPPDRPLKAGFLLVEGVYNTELMASSDVFEHTRYHSGPRPGIEVFTIAARQDPLRR